MPSTLLFQTRSTQEIRTSLQEMASSWSLKLGWFLPVVYLRFDDSYPHRVSSVHPDRVVYTRKDKETGKLVEHEIPANFALWSTGIAMNPFTSKVAGYLPNQVHKKAIEVDSHLRVKGAPLGDVYAVGDCATVSFLSHLLLLTIEGLEDRNVHRITSP